MTAGIDAFAVAVAAVLYVHMNHEGVCWPSVRRIADEAHCVPNAVTSRIKLLEQLGLLEVDRKPRGKNTYQGTLPSVSWDDTEQRRGGAPSVSWAPESVSRNAASVSREGSICVTGCDVTGNREPVNPAQPGGAPGGAPALGGQPTGPEDVAALHQRIEAIFDRLDEHDNNAGIWGNDERDLDPPENTTMCDAFEKRLMAHGYYRINETNERESRDDLATTETYDIAATCHSLEAWSQGGEPPWWLQKTLRRQERFVNPAASLEAIEAIKASKRERIIDNAAADARARLQALATPCTEAR